MALLDRKKLLKRDDFQIRKVDLGDGDFVYVRQMSGRERDRFEQSLIVESKNAESGFEKALDDFRAKLAVVTVCDEQGNLLLEPSDASTLSQNMSAAKLEKIVSVAQELNKITEGDKEALTKNLRGGQAANSTSASV